MPAAKSATKCGSCDEPITKTQGCIECNICCKWLHASCAKLSDKDLSTLKAIRVSAFICAVCEPNLTNVRRQSSVADDVRSLNVKLDSFIGGYQTELSGIKSAIDGMRTEVSSCLTELKTDIVKCNERVNLIEASTSGKIAALEAENNSLHRRLNRGDFLIGGLPEGLDDILKAVIAVAAVFNVLLTKQDINHACYINRKKQILVKLNSVSARDEIMRSYFKTRTLRVCDVLDGPGGDITSRVYLNDHYTPSAGYLNSLCKKLRRLNIIMKFKILNGDKTRAKLIFPDGKETVRDINECALLLNEPHGAVD